MGEIGTLPELQPSRRAAFPKQWRAIAADDGETKYVEGGNKRDPHVLIEVEYAENGACEFLDELASLLAELLGSAATLPEGSLSHVSTS
ncbi:hypothetical protein ACWDKQ_29655 [Saccharopolyspora sp. NPDC000995]